MFEVEMVTLSTNSVLTLVPAVWLPGFTTASINKSESTAVPTIKYVSGIACELAVLRLKAKAHCLFLRQVRTTLDQSQVRRSVCEPLQPTVLCIELVFRPPFRVVAALGASKATLEVREIDTRVNYNSVYWNDEFQNKSLYSGYLATIYVHFLLLTVTQHKHRYTNCQRFR